MELGLSEMVFLFLLALIIFGPKKLPEIGRQLGKAFTDFKRASNEFQSQIEDEVRKLEVETAVQPSIAPPVPPALPGTVERPNSSDSVTSDPQSPSDPQTQGHHA